MCDCVKWSVWNGGWLPTAAVPSRTFLLNYKTSDCITRALTRTNLSCSIICSSHRRLSTSVFRFKTRCPGKSPIPRRIQKIPPRLFFVPKLKSNLHPSCFKLMQRGPPKDPKYPWVNRLTRKYRAAMEYVRCYSHNTVLCYLYCCGSVVLGCFKTKLLDQSIPWVLIWKGQTFVCVDLGLEVSRKGCLGVHWTY